jgi:hypothetical protein
MFALLGGLAILSGLLLLLYLFVNADPAKLARALKWVALAVGAAAVAGLLITGRFNLVWVPSLLMLAPLWRRLRGYFGGGPAPGAASVVATAYLRMTLEHDTGTMIGIVLAGRFAGMRLAELTVADLIDLLRECRAADGDGARLLEAYLDRLHPDWRDVMGGTQSSPPRSGSEDMTVAEAYEILGLEPGADEPAIRDAHHRLMMQMHPDHGGTDYLATKINRARDVLLKH